MREILFGDEMTMMNGEWWSDDVDVEAKAQRARSAGSVLLETPTPLLKDVDPTELSSFAIHGIEKGEELLDNYGTFDDDDDVKWFVTHAGRQALRPELRPELE